MKALVKNTVKSISAKTSIGLVEVVLFVLALAVLLMPIY